MHGSISFKTIFFFQSNYLNSMKCWEISMGPYIRITHWSSFLELEHNPGFVKGLEICQNSQTCPYIDRGGVSTHTHSIPAISLASTISSICVAPRGSDACIWLIGSASDACYCSGSWICSFSQCYRGVVCKV